MNMFAKIKSPVFIDALTLELVAPLRSSLKAILRDERGCERTSETSVPQGDAKTHLKGLNDRPTVY